MDMFKLFVISVLVLVDMICDSYLVYMYNVLFLSGFWLFIQ